MRKDASPLGRMLAFVGLIIVVALFWQLSVSRFQPEPSEEALADIGPDTLAQLTSMGKPGVVEFYISNCVYCARISQDLAKVEEQYGDAVFVVKLSAEKYPAEAAKYNMPGFPTCVYFDASGVEQAIIIGYEPEATIVARMKELGFVE